MSTRRQKEGAAASRALSAPVFLPGVQLSIRKGLLYTHAESQGTLSSQSTCLGSGTREAAARVCVCVYIASQRRRSSLCNV